MSNVLTNEQRKARKSYMCDLCGKKILPKTEYIYTTFVFDGKIYEEHRHIHCDAMIEAGFAEFDAESDEECLYYIQETVCENFCSFEEQEECDLSTILSCEICQNKMLLPNVLEAAKQSVRSCKR